MSTYISAFTTPWMVGGIAVLFVLAAVLTWALRVPLASGARRAAFFGFALACGAIVLVTLVREPPQTWCLDCWTPDWGLPRFLNADLGTEGLLNVVLFVPAAFFAVLVWRAPMRTVAVAALGSLVIEAVQPMIGVGVNDVTDLTTNVAGAMVGATAAAVAMLIFDTVKQRRLPVARTVRVMVAMVAVTALVVGVPSLIASQRQSRAHAQLTRMFAQTTLSDYRKYADNEWLAQRQAFHAANGSPTEEAYTTATVARIRYTWTTFGAVRCIITEWTAAGFSAHDDAGRSCQTAFHS